MTHRSRLVAFLLLCPSLAVANGCRPQSAANQAAAGNSEQDRRPTTSPPLAAGPARNEPAPRFAFYTVDHYDLARDPAADLAATVARAKSERKRILLQVGGDWCSWCKRMSRFIESNDRVRERINRDFLVMKVTYDERQRNELFLSHFPPISGYPHLFVLSPAGELLHSQDTADLEEGSDYNEQVYVSFLEKWKPGT